MAKYFTSRALSDIRLKNWDGGRVAQLKLAVQRLEEQVNESLSQSTVQTASRKVSDQVPFILPSTFTANTGFRQAQIIWKRPPGINGHPFRQLLFYELQHDFTSAFANPTVLTTPQTTVVIAGLPRGGFRSFRVRVVNTFGIAGPWSTTLTVRLARNRIEITPLANTTGTSGITRRLTKDIGQWETILDTSYTPLGGAATINLHAALLTPHHDMNLKVGGSTVETFYSGPGIIQFRFRIGEENSVGDIVYRELGGSRYILSARPGYLATADLEASTPTAFGTFLTGFFRPASGTDIQIQLQAAKMPGTEWAGRDGSRGILISDPLFSIRNALVLELLEQ